VRASESSSVPQRLRLLTTERTESVTEPRRRETQRHSASAGRRILWLEDVETRASRRV